MPRFRKSSVSVIAMLASAAVVFPAVAQDDVQNQQPAQASGGAQPTAAPASDYGDIVVTAQRRAESIQDTPLAISALGGDALQKTGVTDITQLGTRLSNVSINTNAGITRIAIRGIGSNATQPNLETPIAYHVDGVYVSRGEAQGDSFYDVERIEVVRGPQGTLYGRNATGGAVNIITRDPTDEFSGYADFTVGNYSLIQAEAAVSGPLTPTLSFRIAGQAIKRDGFGQDAFGRDIGDQNTRAVRAKLKFEPSSNLKIVASAEYFRERDAAGAQHYIRDGDTPGLINVGVALGYPLAEDPYRNTNSDFPARTSKDDYAFTLSADWDIAPWATLTSITGYRNTDFYTQRDFDNTAFDAGRFYNFSKAHQFSQELRLGGSSGNFTYVIGGFLFDDHLDFTGRTFRNAAILTAYANPGTRPAVSNNYLRSFYQAGILDTRAYAAFGQISYEFTPWLGVDIGGRYSYERKVKPFEVVSNDNVNLAPNPALGPFDPVNLPALNPLAPTRTSFKKFTPKFTVRLQPADNINIYGTYAQGFRSGGYALGSGAAPFAAETVDDYEGGVKMDWFGGRLQTNFAGFYYKYGNLQVFRLNPIGGIIIESAGKADLYGMEASIVAKPTDDLRLNAEIGLLHTEYKVFTSVNSNRPDLGIQDLAGNRLIQSPKYTINAGAEYSWHPAIGDVTLRGEGQFIGKQYYTPFNTETYSQDAFAMFNAFLNFTHVDGKLTAGLFVKNITNKVAVAVLNSQPQNMGGFAAGEIYPLRTFGARVGYRF